MNLFSCMRKDIPWISVTVAADLLVACGYIIIAMHWWRNQKRLEPSPARAALGNLRNIFMLCGVCGYIFIPIKMFWPAWRLYDMVMVLLVYYTWKYALNARGLQVIYTELGRSKQLAAELEQSRVETKRKSFFLNAVSHDLRTPLNSLTLQTELAEISLDTRDEETLKRSLTEIKAGAKAAATLLDSLLECARLEWSQEKINKMIFDIGDFAQHLLNGFQASAAQKGLYLRCAHLSGVLVETDRVKLERILTNLISNALKFTHNGGVSVEIEPNASDLTIYVRDTGDGIDLQHQQHLFDEFFQVHNGERDRTKGFGLGLAIARRLVEQLGGGIAVESAPGQGSCFSIRLPGVLAGAPARSESATERLAATPA
ncbi:MAG TPA: HAMP domain-containing sensor histidine kinase [Tepidisphaeraceae bacterium]